MDTSGEFASLVDAHRRLMVKYGQRGRWDAKTNWKETSNTQGALSVEPRFADGPPWIASSLTVQPASTNSDASATRCCPRCHFWIGSKPLHSNDFVDGGIGNSGTMLPSLPPSSGHQPGINHMISLQLASMEYARLLATLNVGSATTPYLLDGPQALHPYSLDDYSSGCMGMSSKSPVKRKALVADAITPQTIPIKRTRLVWTEELHQRFVDAVERIGINKAVPKAILEEMGVKGLTRENVASHLQKYRKKMRQGFMITKRRRCHYPETDKLSVERSATTLGSNDFAEIDSSASATNNTAYSCTTAMRDQK